MAEQLVGAVTHYFGQPKVAIIEISAAELHVGDTIHITGHTSDFTQQIRSMEIEHGAVDSAKKGDVVGVQVSDRAHEHDQVFPRDVSSTARHGGEVQIRAAHRAPHDIVVVVATLIMNRFG